MHARDKLVEPFLRDAALAAGEGDRLFDLGAIEHLALFAAFHDHDLAQLDALERGEARAAAVALAAAADRGVALGGRLSFTWLFSLAENGQRKRQSPG